METVTGEEGEEKKEAGQELKKDWRDERMTVDLKASSGAIGCYVVDNSGEFLKELKCVVGQDDTCGVCMAVPP